MKTQKFSFLILLIFGILFTVSFSACNGDATSDDSGSNTDQTDETNDSNDSPKELTDIEKGRYLLQNSSLVQVGAIISGFNKVFTDISGGLATTFDAGNAPTQEELDAKLAEVESGFFDDLEEMSVKMGEALDSLQQADPEMYDKFFGHEKMKEGIAIAEKYDYPNGFHHYTQPLEIEEIKRGIMYVTAAPEDSDDTYVIAFQELFKWSQDFNTSLAADPEMAEFMENLKQK